MELLLTLAAMMFVAGLTWKVGGAAIVLRNNACTAVELTRISQALDEFAMTFGVYPPDFHDRKAVVAFLKQRFPKCREENYPVLTHHSPASALYFWLAGPNGKGFSANPKNPFDNGPKRIGPFYKIRRESVEEGGRRGAVSSAARPRRLALRLFSRRRQGVRRPSRLAARSALPRFEERQVDQPEHVSSPLSRQRREVRPRLPLPRRQRL